MLRAPLCSLLMGTALLTAPLAARAADDNPKPYPDCTQQPTEGDVAAAKGAFQAGQAAFNEADYTRAITYWEDAYRRDCTAHALLLNLARAYELNEQKRMAVTSLETFLARNPSTNQRDQIARRIEVLNEKIAKEQGAAGQPGPGPGPDVPPTNGSGSGPVDPGTKSPSRPILPLLVAGGGGVIAIIGGVVYFGGKSDRDDVEAKCGGTACQSDADKEAGNSANSRMTTGSIVGVAGLAIAAGGVAWYFLSEPEGGSGRRQPLRRAHLAPAVGQGFAGFSVGGVF